MVKKGPVYYGIRKGRGAPVVVHSWAEVVEKTHGFSGAEFRKFKSESDASGYVYDLARTPVEPGPPPPGSSTLWFDGGSRGNPGVSGSGAVIFDDTEKELYSGYKYLGDKKTNNEAEYEGLLLGLRAAIKLGTKRLVVKGDSMLVIHQMMGRWRVSASKLVGLHREADHLVRQEQLECTWQHVRRELNARADLLANIAMDTLSGGEVFDPALSAAPACAPASVTSNSCLAAKAFTPSALCRSSRQDLTGSGSNPYLLRPDSPAGSAMDDEREAAAIAAAKVAYEAVAADARVKIVGCTAGSCRSSRDDAAAESFMPRGGAVGSRGKQGQSARTSNEEACGLDNEVYERCSRRFVVHVGTWRKKEDTVGAAAAAAAILYVEEDRGLQELMRVARCCKKPRSLSRNDKRVGADSGTRQGAVARPFLPTEDTLRVLEETLEEVERLGGGDNVAVVTNELALSAALAAPSAEGGSAPGDATELSSLPAFERVLRRWKNLKGVFGWPADSELASAVMLARCCADPPTPSILAWGNADGSNHGAVGESSFSNSPFANIAPSGNEVGCLTSSGDVLKARAEIATSSLVAFSPVGDGAKASGNAVVARGGPTDLDTRDLSGSKRSATALDPELEKASRFPRLSISPEELM